MAAADAPHLSLLVYQLRAARLGLPHTSADPPPAVPQASAPDGGAASGGTAAPPPAIHA